MSRTRSMLMLQRGLMLALAVAGCLVVALRTAKAELETRALSHTRGILGIPDAWVRGAPRSIALNGARIRIASGHSEQTLHDLLDRAERDCRERSGALDARAEALHRNSGRPRLSNGILRAEHGKEGLVACLDLGHAELSLDDLAARLSDFAGDGDLQRLGGVRLLRAEARAQGAFFVTASTEGAVPLWRMFPADGDAPGLDASDVARPVGSRRVLSAWQEQGAPAIHVYETQQAIEALWPKYARELEAAGWKEDAQPSTLTLGAARSTLFMRGGKQVVVTAERQRAKTLIAIMPLDAGPGAARLR